MNPAGGQDGGIKDEIFHESPTLLQTCEPETLVFLLAAEFMSSDYP